MLAQQLLNGVVVGAVYALFALGFTLVFGVNRIMNMAHGSVLTCGAFAGLFCVTAFDAPLPLALIAAAVVGGLVSVLMDVLVFRRLRAQHNAEFTTIVASMGIDLILLSIAQKASNTQVLRFPQDTFPVVIFTVMGLRIQLLQLLIVLASLVLVALLLLYLYRTSFGLQVRSVAFSGETSKLFGIAPNGVHFQVFFVSGALAGIAGVLVGLAFNSVHFMMGESLLLRAFVVIILGGLGSISGTLVAAMLIGIVQTLSVAYVSTGVADAIVFATLFAVLVVRPTGLLGDGAGALRVARQ
ncbi:branched-chain amino acid ABC transporter permease [Ramlibacter sp.]|uniref:branched-chain amino acid ABC transporter permease n=1 Tax=Ramlibacter sp. TaxID=1917967 RepID=UPI003D11B978